MCFTGVPFKIRIALASVRSNSIRHEVSRAGGHRARSPFTKDVSRRRSFLRKDSRRTRPKPSRPTALQCPRGDRSGKRMGTMFPHADVDCRILGRPRVTYTPSASPHGRSYTGAASSRSRCLPTMKSSTTPSTCCKDHSQWFQFPRFPNNNPCLGWTCFC